MSSHREVDTAVVLAGGLGTRARPALGDTPKILANVAGKTLLERKCDELSRNGIRTLFLLLGHGSEAVIRLLSIRTPPDIDLETVLDGGQLQGTGGALTRVLSRLPSAFFLTYGDSLLDASYDPLRNEYQRRDQVSCMYVSQDLKLRGLFNTLAEGGDVKDYVKAGSQEMNGFDYGLMLLNNSSVTELVLGLIPPFDLSIIISRLARAQQLACVTTNERFWEVGTPQSLSETQAHFGGAS